MVEGIVKGIMNTGLQKYAKINETTPDKIQIKITDDKQKTIFYDICKDFKTVERVSLSDIMNKMDIFGYASIVNPKMKEFLDDFAETNNFELEKTCCFILKHNESLFLSFYYETKSIKTISLKKYLEEKGL